MQRKNFYLIVEDYCALVWLAQRSPGRALPHLLLFPLPWNFFFRAAGGNMANGGDFFNGLLGKQQRHFPRSTTTKVRTCCLRGEPPAALRPIRAPPADPGAPSAPAACGISTAAHSNAAPRAGQESPGRVAAASDGRHRETIATRRCVSVFSVKNVFHLLLGVQHHANCISGWIS